MRLIEAASARHQVRACASRSAGLFRPCAALYCARPMEGWPSGLRRTLGKRVYGKPYRGFESHSLRQLASPLSFANSRTHSFLSGKSRYFNAFTSVLRSACDRRGSSTAGTGGWVRGWVEWFSFDFCLPGNRTRDTEDLPTLGTESRQHQNLRHACGWWWLVFASQQYRRSIVDLPLQTKRP